MSKLLDFVLHINISDANITLIKNVLRVTFNKNYMLFYLLCCLYGFRCYVADPPKPTLNKNYMFFCLLSCRPPKGVLQLRPVLLAPGGEEEEGPHVPCVQEGDAQRVDLPLRHGAHGLPEGHHRVVQQRLHGHELAPRRQTRCRVHIANIE